VVEHIEHFWRVIEQTPALQARLLEQQQEFRDELAAVLRSTGVNEWDAWVAAGFIAVAHETIFTTAMRRMLAGEPAKRVRKDQAGVITRAFDAVAAALASLGL